MKNFIKEWYKKRLIEKDVKLERQKHEMCDMEFDEETYRKLAEYCYEGLTFRQLRIAKHENDVNEVKQIISMKIIESESE